MWLWIELVNQVRLQVCTHEQETKPGVEFNEEKNRLRFSPFVEITSIELMRFFQKRLALKSLQNILEFPLTQSQYTYLFVFLFRSLPLPPPPTLSPSLSLLPTLLTIVQPPQSKCVLIRLAFWLRRSSVQKQLSNSYSPLLADLNQPN